MKAYRIISIALTAFVLNFAGITKAATVEYNLFDLGFPTTLDINSSGLSIPFDPEEDFIDITHAYIDWSGEITAALALYYLYPGVTDPPPPPDDPNVPFPVNVSFAVSFVSVGDLYIIFNGGGESTYPAAEPFDAFTGIGCFDSSRFGTWPDPGPFLYLSYSDSTIYTQIVEHGSVTFDHAMIIIEGTPVPEPASLLFLGLGAVILRRRVG